MIMARPVTTADQPRDHPPDPPSSPTRAWSRRTGRVIFLPLRGQGARGGLACDVWCPRGCAGCIIGLAEAGPRPGSSRQCPDRGAAGRQSPHWRDDPVISWMPAESARRAHSERAAPMARWCCRPPVTTTPVLRCCCRAAWHDNIASQMSPGWRRWRSDAAASPERNATKARWCR